MVKPTFFQTGPDKVAPVKNVYDGEKPKYPEKDEGFKKQIADKSVKEKKLKSLDVGKLLRTVKTDKSGRLEFDQKSALKQANALTDDIGDLLNKGTDKQQESILDKMGADVDKPGATAANAVLKLNSKARKISEKIQGSINIGGAAKLIRNGDISSARGVADIINTLSNGSVIKIDDFTSKIAIVQGVMDDLNRYGIIDAIDYILETMEDIEAKKRLLAKMVPSMFINADINGLYNAIDVLGAGKVLSLYPQGIKAFIAGFRFPYGTNTSNYPYYWNMTFGLFNKLDGAWHLCQRNSQTINDLSSLISMNRRFYTVFRYIDHTKLITDIYPGSGLSKQDQVIKFTGAVMTARNYQLGDKERLLRSMYPKASFIFSRR